MTSVEIPLAKDYAVIRDLRSSGVSRNCDKPNAYLTSISIAEWKSMTSSLDDDQDYAGTKTLTDTATENPNVNEETEQMMEQQESLPQCKVRRNYSCAHCNYNTQNPRFYLHHLRNSHNEKFKIFECPYCLYASKHTQKLQRHIHMVHKNSKKPSPSLSSVTSSTSRLQQQSNSSPQYGPDVHGVGDGRSSRPIRRASQLQPEVPSPGRHSSSAGCGQSEESMLEANECEADEYNSDEEEAENSYDGTNDGGKSLDGSSSSGKKTATYQCQKCDYVTNLKARFTKHLKYHSMPMIKCDDCDFQTPYKWNLDRHNKNHCANGAYKCSKCNFSADIRQSLTVHELNHHVQTGTTEDGQSRLIAIKRRCKVGASDTFPPDSPPSLKKIRTSEEEVDDDKMSAVENGDNNHYDVMMNGSFKSKDVVITKSGLEYVKKYKCRVCPYRAAWKSEMARHETKVHGLELTIPNHSESAPVVSNGVCAATGTGSGSAAALLLGSNTARPIPNLIPIPIPMSNRSNTNDARPANTKSAAPLTTKTPEVTLTAASRKRNGTFFQRLAERAISDQNCELVCEICGHKSDYYSAFIKHRNSHELPIVGNKKAKHDDKMRYNGATMVSGSDLSSTRCQYCRQRCKTSSDLFVHLQSCPELRAAAAAAAAAANANGGGKSKTKDVSEEVTLTPLINCKRSPNEPAEEMVVYEAADVEEEDSVSEKTSSGWNDFMTYTDQEADTEDDEKSVNSNSTGEASLFGYEISPGFGFAANKDKPPETVPSLDLSNDSFNSASDYTIKKIFKCPQCSYWASTASRFHVHIVGHLNNKPFECSMCSYKSNWQWDITKHIRLKKHRDPNHENAKVLMTDETGRRNYTKYNKYLVKMKVLTSDGESKHHPDEFIISKATSSKFRGGGNKKTFWKCKKCTFRSDDRSVVMKHVKEHSNETVQMFNSMTHRIMEQENDDSYDSANYFHNAFNNETDMDEGTSSPFRSIQSVHDGSMHTCEICGYFSSTLQMFQEHMIFHEEKTNSKFKCCYCPFYADEKHEIMDHVMIHGVQNPELIIHQLKHKNTTDNDGSLIINKSAQTKTDSPLNSISSELMGLKKFKCSDCPYETNNKSQYLYHEQFHRAKAAPFKCSICTYNVSKRHLLLQHLKLHGINKLPSPVPSTFTDNDNYNGAGGSVVAAEESGDMSSLLDENGFIGEDLSYEDTSRLSDVPLMWVYKQAALDKMYKCRTCPFVHHLKSTVEGHERFHFEPSDSGSGAKKRNTMYRICCTECEFACDKSDTLFDHYKKVHSDSSIKIYALVAPTRADQETQVRDIMSRISSLTNAKVESKNMSLPESTDSGYYFVNDKISAADRLHYADGGDNAGKMLHFCKRCPARFLSYKELEIHSRFHDINLPFKCASCSYGAQRQAHLLAHAKVHTNEYRERTNNLCAMYEISSDYPRFEGANGRDGGALSEINNLRNGSPVDAMEQVATHWLLNNDDQQQQQQQMDGERQKAATTPSPKPSSGGPIKQYACHKCPAKFFKSAALNYHLTLHGSNEEYQCRACDYAVKTYGNLIKHEAVHGLPRREKCVKRNDIGRPTATTPVKKQQTENSAKSASPFRPPTVTTAAFKGGGSSTPGQQSLHVDPEFGLLMHGSSQFNYPTIIKNGKPKDKRYKCPKCPSAFEKREQYKVHLNLHGSKQKYVCEKCDYSVKYFANYAQHLRKHDADEQARTASIENKNTSPKNMVGALSMSPLKHENIGGKSDAIFSEQQQQQQREPLLSTADSQQMILMRQMKNYPSSDVNANFTESHRQCLYCPYRNTRKDIVDSHMKCHLISKSYDCGYCSYSVPQLYTLKEHRKLHFNPMKAVKPEAYMKCDSLELWAYPSASDSAEKTLLFKDNGTKNVEEGERFYPPIERTADDGPNDSSICKLRIDLKTGEADCSQNEDDDECYTDKTTDFDKVNGDEADKEGDGSGDQVAEQELQLSEEDSTDQMQLSSEAPEETSEKPESMPADGNDENVISEDQKPNGVMDIADEDTKGSTISCSSSSFSCSSSASGSSSSTSTNSASSSSSSSCSSSTAESSSISCAN